MPAAYEKVKRMGTDRPSSARPSVSREGEKRWNPGSTAKWTARRRQDRRSFVQRTLLLGNLSACGTLSGCLDAASEAIPGESDGEAVSTAALQDGMELGIGFTGFGGLAVPSEIDPDEPGGGRLVTVDTVDQGEAVTVSWRQTVERDVPPDDETTAGVGEDTPIPETEQVTQTGTLEATGLDDAHATFLPMFWEPERMTTDTSALWLSAEAYRELRDTRDTAWSADVLTRISWVGDDVQEQIREATEHVEDVRLEAEADFVEFDLTTGDDSITVEAIEAHDSFGNEYIILANEANPLVLKFTYNAVSVGVTGFDTGLWSLIKSVFSGYQVVTLSVP